MSKTWKKWLPALIVSIPLLLYVVFPVTAMLWDSAAKPVKNHHAIAHQIDPQNQPFGAGLIVAFARDSTWAATWGTLELSLYTVVFGGLWGTFLALLWFRKEFPGRRIFALLGYAPLLLPPLVGSVAFHRLLGEGGWVWCLLNQIFDIGNTAPWVSPFVCVLILHIYSFGLFTYAFVSAALENTDQSLEEAALNLGANKIQVFWSAVWPSISGPLTASALLVFMAAGASFSGPYLFDSNGHYLTVEIFNEFHSGPSLVAALTLILAGLSLLALPIFLLYEKQSSNAGIGALGVKGASRISLPPAKGIQKWILLSVSILVGALMLLPIFMVIVEAFTLENNWQQNLFPTAFTTGTFKGLQRESWQALGRSLFFGATAATIAVGLAVLISMALRKSFSWAAAPAEYAVMLAIALPGSAVAIALLSAFNGGSILTGSFDIGGTWAILILAYIVRNLPLAVRPIRAAFNVIGTEFELAARSLGANRLRTLFKITLPLMAPTLLAAFILCFIAGAGEFVASILLCNVNSEPISVRIDALFRTGYGYASALSLTLVGLSLISMLAVGWLTQRSSLQVRETKRVK